MKKSKQCWFGRTPSVTLARNSKARRERSPAAAAFFSQPFASHQSLPADHDQMHVSCLFGSRRGSTTVSVLVLVACTVLCFVCLFHAGLSRPGHFELLISSPTPPPDATIRGTSAENVNDSLPAKISPDTKSRRLLDVAKNSTTAPDFQWEYLDLNRNGACGCRKCFYYSSTNNNEGYLVARPKKDDYLPTMLRLWKNTRSLEREHNIRHFSLEPPQNVGVPPRKVLKKLNKAAINPRNSSSYYGSTKKNMYTASNSSLAFGLVVQKVLVAPTPNLILHCSFFKQKGKFSFDERSATKEEFQSAVADKESFVRIFEREMKKLIKVLRKERRLWLDFQMMLDAQGKIYHFDLDRMELKTFRFPSVQGAQKCLSSIMTNVAKFLDIKRNATHVATK